MTETIDFTQTPPRTEMTRIPGTCIFMRIQFALNHTINAGFQIDTTGNDAIVSRIKLELGDTNTLANDPPMDFGRELAVCQRFYEKSYNIENPPGTNTANGSSPLFPRASNIFACGLSFRVRKRISPSVTVYSLNGTVNRISQVVDWTTSELPNNIAAVFVHQSGIRKIQMPINALIATNSYQFHWTASADL